MLLLSIALSAVAALCFAAWMLISIHRKGAGSSEMQSVAVLVEKAAAVFTSRYHKFAALWIGAFAIIVYLLCAVFYPVSPAFAGWTLFSFCAGALFQAPAAWINSRLSLWGASRTAAASKRSGQEAFTVVLRVAGASGVLTLILTMAGILFIFLLANGARNPHTAVFAMTGFSFGSAVYAFLLRLSGGLYSKSLDITTAAEDRHARQETENLPPALAAAIAGESIRSGAAVGAWMFSCASAENIAAMLIGAALWPVYGAKAVLFPLMLRGWGIISSIAGLISAGMRQGPAHMEAINKGYAVTGAVAALGFYFICQLVFDANMWLFTAALIGIVSGYLLVFIADYYGSPNNQPASGLGVLAQSGALQSVLGGLATGMNAVLFQAILLAAVVVGAYYCGARGFEGYIYGGLNPKTCGLYGIAVAVMGALSISCYSLCIGFFSGISAAADSSLELTHQSEEARNNFIGISQTGKVLHRLSGGYLAGISGFIAVLLFGAYTQQVSIMIDMPFDSINMAKAEVFLGGIVGAGAIFVLMALIIKAFLRALSAIKQCAQEGSDLYFGDAIEAVLNVLYVPGIYVCLLPVVGGIVFRLAGLGIETFSVFLVMVIITGTLAVAFTHNGGLAFEGAFLALDRQSKGYKTLRDNPVNSILKDTVGSGLAAALELLPAAALALAPLFI